MSLPSIGLFVSVATAVLSGSACKAEISPMQTPASDRVSVVSVDDVIGFWAVSSSSHSHGDCFVSLNRLSHATGYGVSVEKCSITSLSEVTSWRLSSDGFEFYDEGQSLLMRFRRLSVDVFEAEDGKHRMERAPLA